MIEKSNDINQKETSYEIRINGHLEDRWTEWFEPMTMEAEKDGTMILFGDLPDQTALHGILLKIRNMNLEIISVRQIDGKF
jgi:hypothetical protein